MDIVQLPKSALDVPSTHEAAEALDRARLKAAVGFEFMVELLTLRGFEPSVSTKNALEISDHLYKVSGMAQKQSIQANLPTVRFNFNSKTTSTGSVEVEVTASVNAEHEPNEKIVEDVEDIPEYMQNYPIFGNSLRADLPEDEEDDE